MRDNKLTVFTNSRLRLKEALGVNSPLNERSENADLMNASKRSELQMSSIFHNERSADHFNSLAGSQVSSPLNRTGNQHLLNDPRSTNRDINISLTSDRGFLSAARYNESGAVTPTLSTRNLRRNQAPGIAENEQSELTNRIRLSARPSLASLGHLDDVIVKSQRSRKLWKKALYVCFFWGIMKVFLIKVKVYGPARRGYHTRVIEEGEHKTVDHQNKYFPLSPSCRFKVFWNIVLLLLLLYTAILTPVRVAFVDQDSGTWVVIEYLFDFLFVMDVVVNFLSSYRNKKNRLVTDWKLIAKDYVLTWFIIDFISAMPLDLITKSLTTADNQPTIGGTRYNRIFRLFRLLRMYRLIKILRLFKLIKAAKTGGSMRRIMSKINLNLGLFRMVNVLISVLYINHLLCCLWFFAARIDDGPETWVSRMDLRDASPVRQYIAGYYWALQTLTTVGYGDIHPYTSLERIIAIAWMLSGVGFYSFTIGNLSNILSNIDKRALILKNKIDAFNAFALKINLTEFLRQKVQRFFEINHRENVYTWIEPPNLLEELPYNVRTQLILFSYAKLIKDIKLLKIDANFTAAIVTKFKLLRLRPKEILYREEDPSTEVYFIVKGSVKLVNEDGDGIAKLLAGSYMGEIEVLDECKRTSFSQAIEDTLMLIIDKKSFLDALKDFPLVDSEVRQRAKGRKEKFESNLIKINADKQLQLELEVPKSSERESTPKGTPLGTPMGTPRGFHTPRDSPSRPKDKLLKSNDYFSKMIQTLNKQRSDNTILKISTSPSKLSRHKTNTEASSSPASSSALSTKSPSKFGSFSSFFKLHVAKVASSASDVRSPLSGDITPNESRSEHPETPIEVANQDKDKDKNSEIEKQYFGQQRRSVSKAEDAKISPLSRLFKNKIFPDGGSKSPVSNIPSPATTNLSLASLEPVSRTYIFSDNQVSLDNLASIKLESNQPKELKEPLRRPSRLPPLNMNLQANIRRNTLVKNSLDNEVASLKKARDASIHLAALESKRALLVEKFASDSKLLHAEFEQIQERQNRINRLAEQLFEQMPSAHYPEN